MADDRPPNGANWNNIFRGVVVAMFTISTTLIGALYSNVTRDSDKLEIRIQALEGRMNVSDSATAALRQQVVDDEREARRP